MPLTIHEVKTKRELRQFVNFPYALYRNHPCWIPPLQLDEMTTLRKDKNPAFDYCEARYWLAKKDGRVVGRIAGILNQRYIETWGKKQMRFGWIDFEEDPEIAKALLETVEAWAKEKGMDAVHGPLGFTDLDYEGMLVEGFDELGTMVTIYNYPYYPKFLEEAGYQKDIDWVEFEIEPSQEIPERLDRIADIALKRLHLRPLVTKKRKELLPYAPKIFDLLDEAYRELYGVVPLTRRQVDYYTKMYFTFIKPDYVTVILDENDQVVAFGITMPSLSMALQKCRGHLFPFGLFHLLKALKKNDRADLYLVGVKPELQGKGVNAVMIREINKIYSSHGIKKVESNPELETNKDVHGQWKFYDRRQHKRRRCFIKTL